MTEHLEREIAAVIAKMVMADPEAATRIFRAVDEMTQLELAVLRS